MSNSGLRSRRAPGRTTNEATLVRLARSGDDDAFAQIVRRYQGPLLGYCRSVLRNSADAEDAVQLVFISALRRLRVTTTPIDLRPWLFRIAHNRCISLIRSRREHGELDDRAWGTRDDPAPVPSGAEIRETLGEVVADVRRLPADQQAALVLSQVAGLSGAEVADVLACSGARVRTLVHQARSSLRADREARSLSCTSVKSRIRAHAPLDRCLRRHLRLCESCSAKAAAARTPAGTRT